MGIKNQRRVAKASAPSSVDKSPEDVALDPATVQSVELMMVRTTRCQTAVRRQSVRLHGAVSLLLSGPRAAASVEAGIV